MLLEEGVVLAVGFNFDVGGRGLRHSPRGAAFDGYFCAPLSCLDFDNFIQVEEEFFISEENVGICAA